MATRLPSTAMVTKLVRVLCSQHTDTHELKKVFQYTNRPPIGGSERRVCFPFSCSPIDEHFHAVILNWAALEA